MKARFKTRLMVLLSAIAMLAAALVGISPAQTASATTETEIYVCNANLSSGGYNAALRWQNLNYVDQTYGPFQYNGDCSNGWDGNSALRVDMSEYGSWKAGVYGEGYGSCQTKDLSDPPERAQGSRYTYRGYWNSTNCTS